MSMTSNIKKGMKMHTDFPLDLVHLFGWCRRLGHMVKEGGFVVAARKGQLCMYEYVQKGDKKLSLIC